MKPAPAYNILCIIAGVFMWKRIWIAVMALLCFAMALLMKKQNRREYIATDNKSCTEKMVAITFDDGPSQLTTPVLLKGLKERGICATFFLVGENAVDNPGLVKQMSQEGHVIGNHTFSHIILNRVSMKNALEEIMKTNEVIEKITGKPVKYIRPPCGEYDDELLYSVNLRPVMWDVDPEDWKCHNVRTLVDRVVKNVKDGDIILFHDIYRESVTAALEVIDILEKRGYKFVSVEDILIE